MGLDGHGWKRDWEHWRWICRQTGKARRISYIYSRTNRTFKSRKIDRGWTWGMGIEWYGKLFWKHQFTIPRNICELRGIIWWSSRGVLHVRVDWSRNGQHNRKLGKRVRGKKECLRWHYWSSTSSSSKIASMIIKISMPQFQDIMKG